MPLPTPAPGTLKWWIVGTLGIGAGIAIAVWFGLSATVGQPRWQTFGYHVVDDRTVDVTFDVTRPDGRAMVCTVEALDENFASVGSVEVDVPPSPTDTSRIDATVRTTTRAVTGNVKTCTFA